MLGLGLSLSACAVMGAIDPVSLFRPGDTGILLDPSRLQTLSQDSAGATPVTAAGQPVGRVMDLSGGARHATQGIPSARPTYQVDSGGRPYLAFDGLDDWLTIASFAMSARGRTVVSALRKNSDTPVGSVVEHRPAWTRAGGIAHFAPGGNGSATFGTRFQSTAVQSIISSPASYAAPRTAVLSSVAQTSSHVQRINGAQVASDAPTGLSDATTAGMTVGARDGSTLFANVRIYGLLVIDRVLSITELAQVESWAAARCGVTIA